MKLCSDGHDEVCYEAKHCPACDANKRSDQFEDGLMDALREIGELKAEIRDLQGQIQ
jgi:hypothetical protein